MDSKNAILISQFGSKQAGILFKTLVLQKLYPGKFLISNPCPYDELTDEEVEVVKDALRQLMPWTRLSPICGTTISILKAQLLRMYISMSLSVQKSLRTHKQNT